MEVVLIVTKGILKEVKNFSVWYEMQFEYLSGKVL